MTTPDLQHDAPEERPPRADAIEAPAAEPPVGERTLRARLWTHLHSQRRAVAGLMVPALLAAWTVSGVLAAPPPPPLDVAGERRYGMTPLQRHQLFIAIAANEARWRGYGTRKFPRAPWSADDDYHWHVQAHVERTLAKRHKMSSSRLWALYDEAVHGGWRLDRALPASARPASAEPKHAEPKRAELPAAATATTSPPPGHANAALRATVVPLRPRQR